MSKVLTVALNPSLDKTVRVDQLTLGHDMLAEDICVIAGGKAINVARALRELKIDAGIFGIAAGTAGRRLEALLSGEGAAQHWVWSDGETRTNLTVLDKSSGQARRILEAGPCLSAAVVRTMQAQFSRKLKSLNAVVLTGSLPPGMPPRVLAGMIRSAQKANVLTALDTSGQALAEGLKARPFLVKPNRAEAEEVCGFRIRSRAGMKKALQYLSQRSNIVLISLGAEGLIASDTVRMFCLSGPVIRQGHTVGCGDVALAGFLAGFLNGDVFESCLRFAVACGTANVGAEFPGRICRRRVTAIEGQVKIERL